jgi:hypothetical protein
VTLPSVHGESIVLAILDKSNVVMDLDSGPRSGGRLDECCAGGPRDRRAGVVHPELLVRPAQTDSRENRMNKRAQGLAEAAEPSRVGPRIGPG